TDKKVFLGEEVLLIINMTNKNEDEDTTLSSLDIYLPSGLTYLSTATIKKEGTNLTLRSQQVEKNGNIIHYEDKFNRDQSKFIILKLKAIKAGSSNIFIFSKYSAGELGEEEEQKETLEVENQEISIQTSFKDDEKFDSGEETYIKINVINPSEEVTLKNIAVGVKTPIYNFSPAFIKYLNTLSNQPAINQKIAMPTVSSNKDFKFDVTIDYETEFGERFEKTFEYTITVDAIEGLVVTHELSEASVEEGGEITVKTKVENKRNVDIKDVQVFDVIHMDLGRKGLSSVSNININALDTVTAYEYTILAPEEVKADTKYKIRATAKYTEDNKTYAFEKEDEITVTKKKLDLSISRAVSDPTPYMGTILDVLYTISNPEDEELRDIVVRFPVQEDVELVGDKNFTIGKLDPGESYTMKNVHKIRAKQNGTLTIKPATFIYEDKNGNIFVKNSSEISFSPKFGYIAGPAYNISQKSPEQVKAGDNIKITLNVKNIGTEQGKINVIDGGNSWIFNLEPGEQETASYSYQALKTGEFKVKPLKGEYYYLGKKIYTISNELSVNVYEEGPPEEIQEEEVTPQEEISVEGVTERKTFFGIVWDTIKQVFSLIRR
ncbi:hypothetical protein KY308_03150, partial [Candidatus Woesearchaeota archaeon]|nr:hypothetical protein [Candidatus Woesearchaeota archaeon]